MALLLLSGQTELQPGEYREERVEVLSPIDNTAILVRSLALPSTDYLSFLARGYGVRDVLPSGEALLAAIEREHPEHLVEAAQVVAADGQFMPPAEGGRHLA